MRLVWHGCFIALARRFRWTPDQIARLTLAQISLLLHPPSSGARIRRLSVASGLAWSQQRQQERRAEIDRHLE